MKRYVLYLVILIIMFLSCQNEGRWYPDAEVESVIM
jgi:hypothetical protein